MKFCEFCGRDISHHTHKLARYCKKSDGENGCFKQRTAQYRRETLKRIATEKKKRCPVCGKIVSSLRQEACSYECALKLRHRKKTPETRKDVKMSGHLSWPYNLPMDPAVTPSMMDPMG